MNILWIVLWSLAFLAFAAALLLRWLADCGLELSGARGLSVSSTRHQGQTVGAKELGMVFLLALLLRVAVALVVFVLVSMGQGGLRPLSQLPLDWIRWDAYHYVHLVDLGYQGYIENGQHLFLVFFPLYVWLVRPVALLLGSTPLAGMLVSFLCYAGGCCYLYRLGVEEYGRKVGRRAVLYLSIFPFAFFFGGIMTESLFFLTTAAGLYAIKHHRWLRAGLWGILAALTRMHGVLLIIAAGAELLESMRPFEKRGKVLKQALWSVVKKIPVLLLPLLGTAGYLLLNHWVDGNAFSFTMQQQHWSQGFLWFPQTLWYVIKNAWSYHIAYIRMDIWVPESILFFVFAGVLLASWRRHRNMYTMHAFAYLILNYCLSWLLSAGRYLSCGLPFFLFAAQLTRDRPRAHVAVVVVMVAGFVFYLTRHLTGGQVM